MSAESALVANIAKAMAISRDDLPKLGEWYWVKVRGDGGKKAEKYELMCATHVGSNHTVFSAHFYDYSSDTHVMHWHALSDTRPAPEWKQVIEQRLEKLKEELSAAVRELADVCASASLISAADAPKVETLLPSVTRQDPEQYKKALIRLKEKQFPAMKGSVESLTKQLVGQHKNLYLAQRAQMEMMQEAMKQVDSRLFALELYAGFHENVHQIQDGEPAPVDTPVTVRQMLRYMDEETLIAAEDGGMDFEDIATFDRWAADNLKTVCPEPRCLVAFRVRRDYKDYGPCRDLYTAMAHIEWHKQDMKTYLLIRNGERAYRFRTALDFSPRLLPLREEFDQPLYKDHYWSDEQKRPITPEDVEFDKCMAARMQTVMHYNRITFLLQGLLDRSKVFEPHPPIALSDEDAAQQWVKFNYDEEDGLPSAHPPVWEEYQARVNRSLKAGDVVYARFEVEAHDRVSHRDVTLKKAGYFKVTRVSRDGKKLKINEPWGKRWGYEHKDSWGRGYHGKWGEWPVNKRRHYDVEMSDVFNVAAYAAGDYKTFLCDPYLKGAYLEWAPFLLKAERFLKLDAAEREKCGNS